MFEDEGDFFDQDQQYGENWGDRERVGGIDHPLLMNTKLGAMTGTTGYTNLAKIQERFFKINASAEEKFAHVLQAVYYQYKDELGLREDAFIEMLDAVLTIPNIYYKNPTCYLLGYYIIEQHGSHGARINKTKLNEINNLIKSNQDIGIVDIIRYCRLWINKYADD